MNITNFRQQILIDPVLRGADYLRIISGYATPSMAAWHIQRLNDMLCKPIHIDLIVGMTVTEGIHQALHNGFQDVVRRYSNLKDYSELNCKYVFRGYPVHSKIYIWGKGGEITEVYIGSANYTQKAFSNKQRELLKTISSDGIEDYYNLIEKDTIFCTSGEVEEYIQINNEISNLELAEEISGMTDLTNTITLSLLKRDESDVGDRSGLNWGQRAGREPNQAYIPLPADKARLDFFPVKQEGEDKAPHFTVITDDSKSLVLRVEQANNKAITTPENNSRLGEYFRNRLGLPNGAKITKEDLLRYGRTDVTFIKLDDDQYYMDFSV